MAIGDARCPREGAVPAARARASCPAADAAFTVSLACPPGELHDLPLLIFGILLNRRGWRVDFFGANTPVAEVIDGARRSPPDLIVVAATAPERLTAISADLAHLATVAPLALAGAGASPAAADAVGAELLTGDPVTAAE
jgi:methanogenic corrinoid protein MtbC1